MIPHPATVFLLAAPATQKVTHARFLVLIVGIVVVFLGALALLTILRMLRRRTSARLDGARKARAGGATGAATSAWHTAGQRATPEPRRAGSKPSGDDDSDDDGDADDDGSGEFPALDDTDFGDDDDDDDDDAGPPGRFA